MRFALLSLFLLTLPSLALAGYIPTLEGCFLPISSSCVDCNTGVSSLELSCPSQALTNATSINAFLVSSNSPLCDYNSTLNATLSNGTVLSGTLVSCEGGRHKFVLDTNFTGAYSLSIYSPAVQKTASCFFNVVLNPGASVKAGELDFLAVLLVALAAAFTAKRRLI